MYSNGKDGIADEIYWGGGGISSYEQETTSLFVELLKFNRVIFDVGANTGIYSLIASSYSLDNQVHAFEPLIDAYQRLCINKDINNLNNLICNNIALGNYDGTSYLESLATIKIPTSSSLRKNIWQRDPAKIFNVKIQSLDTYVRNNSIEKVDLIKIDTEGTENFVLEGGRNLIVRDRPTIISEVLYNVTENELHKILDNKGYKYFHITKEGLISSGKIMGNSELFRNYLFIHESRIDKELRTLFLKY